MGGLIGMERKGYELTGYWTNFATFNFDLMHDLTLRMTFALDFKSQILKNPYLKNGWANLYGAKGMRIDRMLDPICDLDLRFSRGQIF